MPALSYYFKVLCPYCQNRLPVRFAGSTSCSGVFLKCKNRDCKKEFELVIEHGKQVFKNNK